jgi:hypothetical protein
VHVDCSNDELVERSMASILSERFPQEGRLSLLIADEFRILMAIHQFLLLLLFFTHIDMLSVYHKEELIGWVLQRLEWLKVVLVANRSDDMDSLLLQSANKQVGDSSTCTVRQYPILCTLSQCTPFTPKDISVGCHCLSFASSPRTTLKLKIRKE